MTERSGLDGFHVHAHGVHGSGNALATAADDVGDVLKTVGGDPAEVIAGGETPEWARNAN